MATEAQQMKAAVSTVATSTSFTAKTPTTTKPSGGNGVVDLFAFDTGQSQGAHVPDHMVVNPYGTDANNETFDMRVWGWSRNVNDSSSTPTWEPFLIIEVNVILGNISTTARESATTYDADTITAERGDTETVRIVSPGDDLSAYFIADITGCELIEFDFDMTGTAGANALYRFI